VRRLGAAALLALGACRPAAPGVTLLFFGPSSAAPLGTLTWVADPDSSRLLGFDRTLRIARVISGPALAAPVSVAATNQELLVTERTGEGTVFDTAGHLLREWDGPDPANVYAAATSVVVAARSPYYVPFQAEPDTAALLTLLDTLGHVVGRIGTVRVPAIPFFVELANAGAVATDRAGAVYWAPYIRDDVSKYDRSGALRWRAERDRFATGADPVLVPQGRTPTARYAVVNYALALGPTGRLYVLGARDSAGTAARVDVVDTASGALVSTRALGPHETAVALENDSLVTFDADSLRARAPSTGPEAFGPPFALPDTAGDTVRLASLDGRVALINFWASWCDPCRAEFPHMAALYRDFSRQDLALVAISDDLVRADMLRFVRELKPPFPVLVGAGRMKERYHYRGLPYSVLIDRHGRIIERIFGFGGPEAFATLRATIANAVRAP